MYGSTGTDSGSGAALGIVGIIILIFWVAVAVFYIATFWKIFSKAGRPGWLAIIPIVNTIVLIQITGRSGWWILAFFVPILDLVALILILYDLSRSFGYGGGFTVGLLLLSFIFFPILGFGPARYVGPAAKMALQPVAR